MYAAAEMSMNSVERVGECESSCHTLIKNEIPRRFADCW